MSHYNPTSHKRNDSFHIFKVNHQINLYVHRKRWIILAHDLWNANRSSESQFRGNAPTSIRPSGFRLTFRPIGIYLYGPNCGIIYIKYTDNTGQSNHTAFPLQPTEYCKTRLQYIISQICTKPLVVFWVSWLWMKNAWTRCWCLGMWWRFEGIVIYCLSTSEWNGESRDKHILTLKA